MAIRRGGKSGSFEGEGRQGLLRGGAINRTNRDRTSWPLGEEESQGRSEGKDARVCYEGATSGPCIRAIRREGKSGSFGEEGSQGLLRRGGDVRAVQKVKKIVDVRVVQKGRKPRFVTRGRQGRAEGKEYSRNGKEGRDTRVRYDGLTSRK